MAQLELHSQVDKEDRALGHPGAAGLLLAHHDHAQLGQVQQETNGLSDLHNTLSHVLLQ